MDGVMTDKKGESLLPDEPFQPISEPRTPSDPPKPATRYKGKIKWFNNAKGHGFIGREDGPDVFVNLQQIEAGASKTLKEGDDVEFSIDQGTKGPMASEVKRIMPEADQKLA